MQGEVFTIGFRTLKTGYCDEQTDFASLKLRWKHLRYCDKANGLRQGSKRVPQGAYI